MAEYPYAREFVNGEWDIDHPGRVDDAGRRLRLAKEVEAALPGLGFKLQCHATEATFDFDAALSQADEDALSQVVADHKANVVTAGMLAALKANRIRECEVEADQYIQSEHGYDINRQLSLQNRLRAAEKDGLTDREAYIQQLPDWTDTVIAHYRVKRADIIACGTAAAVAAVTWDFSQFNASDPGVSIDGALDIPT